MINKEKFYIPKEQAESYDGDVIKFRFSEQDLSQFQREPPNIYGENTMPEQETKQQTTDTNEEVEENIPLTEEKLDVSKKSQENQATITKKPITKTKTVEVPLTREELSIEKFQGALGGSGNEIEAQSPIQSEEDIKIPLKREEAKLQKNHMLKKKLQ